jgi:hypothetical protein
VFPLVTHRGFETDEKSDGALEDSQFDFGNAMAPLGFPNSISHMRCHPSLFPIPFRLSDATLGISIANWLANMVLQPTQDVSGKR